MENITLKLNIIIPLLLIALSFLFGWHTIGLILIGASMYHYYELLILYWNKLL